jgi:hypothetical protein
MEEKNEEISLATMSYWQKVFAQSKANGARYEEEEYPNRVWEWPKDTYLQKKLQRVEQSK